jgi:hypothetical protein
MDESPYLALLQATLNEHPERTGPLSGLFGLELKAKKVPFDAWLAVIWSGEAGVPVPEWAVLTFKDISDRYISGHVQSLDEAFGFKGVGKGKTSELLRRVHHVQRDTLCQDVWKLTLLGYKVLPACRLVARRFQQDTSKIYEESIYKLLPGNGDSAEYLRTLYYKWLKENRDTWIPFAKPQWLAWLMKNQHEYLKQYPSD